MEQHELIAVRSSNMMIEMDVDEIGIETYIEAYGLTNILIGVSLLEDKVLRMANSMQYIGTIGSIVKKQPAGIKLAQIVRDGLNDSSLQHISFRCDDREMAQFIREKGRKPIVHVLARVRQDILRIHDRLKGLRHVPMGVDAIAKERLEQLEKHGRSIQFDVEVNKSGQLVVAAGDLLVPVLGEQAFRHPPLNWDLELWKKMLEKPLKERLVIAGAFIAAELDRLEAVEYNEQLKQCAKEAVKEEERRRPEDQDHAPTVGKSSEAEMVRRAMYGEDCDLMKALKGEKQLKQKSTVECPKCGTIHHRSQKCAKCQLGGGSAIRHAAT